MAENRSQAPTFGEWESEDASYTAYFENPRKIKGEKLNQTIPEYKQEQKVAMPTREDSYVRRVTESPLHHGAAGRTAAVDSPIHHNHGVRSASHRSDSPLHHGVAGRTATVDSPIHHNHGVRSASHKSDSPLHHKTMMDQGATSESPFHKHSDMNPSNVTKRGTRLSAGSDRSFEQSPMHRHHHARSAPKTTGVSSPTWERRGLPQGSSNGSAPLTPGRSRLRSVTQGSETPDHSASVPKFGEWDNNPASAENYTHIFKRVREEKSNEASGPTVTTETSISDGKSNQHSKECCCLPWRSRR